MKELVALNSYFKKYRIPIILGIFCVIISNIAGIYVPIWVREGVNYAIFQTKIAGTTASLDLISSISYSALGFAVFIVIASVVKGIFMYLMRRFIIDVSRKIEYDLKNDIYNKYQQLSAAFYRNNHTGDLMARIGEDVSNVRMYVGPAVMYFTNFLFTFVIVLFQMLHINSELTLYVLVPLPIMSYAIYKISKIINKKTSEIQAQLSILTTQAQETFSGIRVVKSFAAETYFANNFFKHSELYKKSSLKLAFVSSMFFPMMVLLVGLSTLFILYFGGLQVAAGKFTAGNIAEFIIYLNMLIFPMSSLGYTTALVQKAAASQKRINEFLFAEKNEDKHKNNLNNLSDNETNFNQTIVFNHVSFSYPNTEKKALQNINFSIEKNSIIGITGQTGCGKSTLARLLVREYECTEGSIIIDNKNINLLPLKNYLENISYVSQDMFLFSDTIKENILFGANETNVELQTLEKVITDAALDKDIAQFNDGVETMLGERGVSLSGGQIQRVSIARALLRNAPIIVFDDCLSAVDAETEMRIIENLKNALINKTAIIISHRIAPLQLCDTILVMANGEIISQGKHDYLLANNVEYQNMYRLQTEEGK